MIRRNSLGFKSSQVLCTTNEIHVISFNAHNLSVREMPLPVRGGIWDSERSRIWPWGKWPVCDGVKSWTQTPWVSSHNPGRHKESREHIGLGIMVPEMHVTRTLVINDFNDDELWAELGTRCGIRAEGNKFLLSPAFQQRILEDLLHS